MKIERCYDETISIDVQAKSKEKLTIMLTSDWHYDSASCAIDLLTRHLKVAEEMQAVVLVAGDVLDVMQGREDPRRSIEDLKNLYRMDSYFDAVVADTAKFLSGFDVPAFVLCDGNHEMAVLKHNGVDLLSNVCYQLRYQYHKTAVHGGYYGYMPIYFHYNKGSATKGKLLYWYHGTSSHAVVTKGMIQVNRQGVWLPDPDYVLNGHTHDAYTRPEPIEHFSMKTRRSSRGSKLFFRSPGYMMSSTDTKKTQGYSARKRAPKNLGCYFLTLEYSHSRNDSIEHSYTSVVR